MKMKVMFKNIIYSALLLTGLLIGTGCKKQLDINTDPNNPSIEQGTPQLIFPAAS